MRQIKINFPFLLLLILFWIHGNNSYCQGVAEKTFIVSLAGSDNNPGTHSLPLATLEAARDAARRTGSGSNRIVVMPGDYYLLKPFELDSRDNGLTIEADTSGIVTLYGGRLITGWRRDGDKFWCADLPGVKEGSWDFRALVVNGRMPERSRMPHSGRLKNLSLFNSPWLTTVGGGFARQPTPEELISMPYDPKDIPESLDIKNAEVRIYHSWDESLVGVASNDIKKHVLIFSKPTTHPAGGFRNKDYVIYNTREGMTKPGQWYLDRTNGRLVYWPLEGEDMTTAKIIAPRMEQIINIEGELSSRVENLTIRGLVLQATTMPLKSAGFGGSEFDGALTMQNTHKFILEKLKITCVGGSGISGSQINDGRIINCDINNTGACGVKIIGVDIFFGNNLIHDAGLYYPSAGALYVNRSNRLHIYRNEIFNSPYCGMIIGVTENTVIEENLISRVMLELHDGAAIYTSGAVNCIIRGNVARDIKVFGDGHGARAYYLDEGSYDCIIEKNISIGVAEPTHNHMARNSIIRDNLFIADEDISLTFQRSSKMSFEGNTVITPGRIILVSPNALTSWNDNKLFSEGRDKNNIPQAFKIDSDKPVIPIPGRRSRPIEIIRTIKPPKLDGKLSADEWPGDFQRLERESMRTLSSGAPVMVKFSSDNKFLYIGAIVTMFDIADISKGDKWGKDDGVEISISGFDKGNPVTFVIRSYTDGTVQSVTDAGATALAAERLGKSVQFVSKLMQLKGWVGEWAIPLDAIGLKPKPDMKVAFNMCAYVNEYDNWHNLEGTLSESWKVDQAGILQFK